jgi:hypothetical protein
MLDSRHHCVPIGICVWQCISVFGLCSLLFDVYGNVDLYIVPVSLLYYAYGGANKTGIKAGILSNV